MRVKKTGSGVMDLLDKNALPDHALQCIRWCINQNDLDALNQHLRLHIERLVNMEEDIAGLLFDAVAESKSDGLRTVLLYLDDTVMERKKSDNGKTLVNELLCQVFKNNKRDIEIIEKLLQRGADPNLCHKGSPILHTVICEGYLDVADIFLQHGADITWKNSRGDNILHTILVSQFKIETVQWLIDKGIDIHEKSSSGKSPIHLAAGHSAQAVNLLLKLGCDVNLEDDINNDTPLHVACAFCCEDGILELLRHGAKSNKLNKQGHTPLQKLLQFAQCQNDFHSKTRRRIAMTLIQIGFKIMPISSQKCQSTRLRRDNAQRKGRDKVYEMYISISASIKDVNSLKSISRSFIMNTITQGVKVGECVAQLDIPETLKSYLLFENLNPLESS